MQSKKKIELTSILAFLTFSIILSSLPMTNAAGAYDWPKWGHDLQHTGYSTSPAPNTNQTLWNYTCGGWVGTSSAVTDGRVYVSSVDGKVYCLDAATGAHLWNHTTGIMFSSPAVADGRVYVGSHDNKVYCLDAASGALIWNYTTGGAVRSSPAVANSKVYVGSDDNKTYALNAATGTLIWNYTTGGLIGYSSPAVADGKVYIGSTDNKAYCLNAADGAFIWSYKSSASLGYYYSPAVANGVVYIGSLDRKVYAFSAEPPVPEGLTLGVMLLLSSVAVIVSMRYFRKRPKWQDW
jgi:outer membrane protein assembly factor BamB